MTNDLTVGTPGASFFSDASGAAPFSALRAHGRAFFGDSADFDGGLGQPNATSKWLGDVVLDNGDTKLFFERSARVVSSTDYGIAFSAAARTKPATDGTRSIGGFWALVHNRGVRDNPAKANTSRAWAFYSEAIHDPADGAAIDWTHSAEFQVASYRDDGRTDGLKPSETLPSQGGATGVTIGVGINPAERPSGKCKPALWALRIEGLAGSFRSGILVRGDALTPWGDGRTRSMLMPRASHVAWFDRDDREQFAITSTAHGEDQQMRLEHNPVGVTFSDAQNNPVLFVDRRHAGGGAPNYVTLSADADAPSIKASGPRGTADIDLALEPKGDGRVRLGYGANKARSHSGFRATHILEIKDASGKTYHIPAAPAAW